MKKTLLILTILAILMGGVWYFTKPSKKAQTNTNTAAQNGNSNTSVVNSNTTVNINRVVNANSATTANVNASATRTFTNTVLGYSYRYSSAYSYTEPNTSHQTQQFKKTGGQNVNGVSVDAEIGTGEDQGKTFADLAVEKAKLGCSAAGPEGTIECPAVSQQTAITTPTGLTGLKLMLREVTENTLTNTTTERTRGPVYVLNVQSASGNKMRLILVSFMPTGTTATDDEYTAFAKVVADSVTFTQ